VISLYARGMITRDIHDQVQDLYGIEMSAEMVSKITYYPESLDKMFEGNRVMVEVDKPLG